MRVEHMPSQNILAQQGQFEASERQASERQAADTKAKERKLGELRARIFNARTPTSVTEVQSFSPYSQSSTKDKQLVAQEFTRKAVVVTPPNEQTKPKPEVDRAAVEQSNSEQEVDLGALSKFCEINFAKDTTVVTPGNVPTDSVSSMNSQSSPKRVRQASDSLVSNGEGTFEGSLFLEEPEQEVSGKNVFLSLNHSPIPKKGEGSVASSLDLEERDAKRIQELERLLAARIEEDRVMQKIKGYYSKARTKFVEAGFEDGTDDHGFWINHAAPSMFSNIFRKSSGVVNQRLVNEFKEVLKRYKSIILDDHAYAFNVGIGIDACHSVGGLYKLIHGREANVTYLEDEWLEGYIKADGVLDVGPSHSSGSISHQQELEGFVGKFSDIFNVLFTIEYDYSEREIPYLVECFQMSKVAGFCIKGYMSSLSKGSEGYKQIKDDINFLSQLVGQSFFVSNCYDFVNSPLVNDAVKDDDMSFVLSLANMFYELSYFLKLHQQEFRQSKLPCDTEREVQKDKDWLESQIGGNQKMIEKLYGKRLQKRYNERFEAVKSGLEDDMNLVRHFFGFELIAKQLYEIAGVEKPPVVNFVDADLERSRASAGASALEDPDVKSWESFVMSSSNESYKGALSVLESDWQCK